MEQTKSIIRATMLRELGLDFGLIEPCVKVPKSRAGCSRHPPPVNQTAPKARAGCSRDPRPLDQMASKSAVDVLADRLWERYFTPKDIGLEESFKGKSESRSSRPRDQAAANKSPDAKNLCKQSKQ